MIGEPMLVTLMAALDEVSDSSSYMLPVVFSLFAGLSTGIGGVMVLFFRNNIVDLGVIAFMLSTAAASMITVSIVDLFWSVAEVIGMSHTLLCCVMGYFTVWAVRKFGPSLLHEPKADETTEHRLERVGIITAVTLTAHNLPEGMAVALSTMGSSTLGLKMALAIALHNIPEGLAITGPLLMSRQTSARNAIGLALVSGLSEPVGAILTLVFFKGFLTQALIDYALAYVGGVMVAVATLELVPEALRTERHWHTVGGLLCGTVVMGLSLQALGE
uniref:Uncharacterized protein n=1 Tax=Hemiselmis tepida TaxID=464990 RepID=A0A7S0YXP9_9CRYP|mmetsp:Transcript_28580/g.72405  ORF Transcript_28580/g.72405 Transcript_28580/m.72405 type:complete len:274 (+) Transcript_28580:420-1241(+)